jgi:DNA anti-recombination protein RmuC
MATPALKFESEELPVEDRIGKLEAHVEHIQADVADTKIEVRRLNDKLDGLNQTLSAKIDNVHQTLLARIDDVNKTLSARIEAVNQSLSARIDDVNKTLSAKIDAIHQQLAELKISRALDRVWWLLMCGTLLGVMARGFKWI